MTVSCILFICVIPTGTIPSTFNQFSGLLFLYTQSNALSGSDILPFLSTSVNGIDISDNLFSGELPFNASGWYVVDLYARDNYLSGTIPTDLAFLKHIENLDISNNLFVGALPGQLNQVQYVLCVCVSATP